MAVVNPYAGTRVESRYDRGILKPVENQADYLVERFSDLHLNPTGVQSLASAQVLPTGAEYFGVFPKPSIVATRLGLQDMFVMPEYERLLQMVRHRTEEGYSCDSRKIRRSGVRVLPAVVGALRRVEAMQSDGDFIVVPVQTGVRYAGRTIQDARWDMEHLRAGEEFPMPAFMFACLFMGHRTMIGRWYPQTSFNTYCGGDELMLSGNDTKYSGSLRFGRGGHFIDETVWIDVRPIDYRGRTHGCASFFVPKLC